MMMALRLALPKNPGRFFFHRQSSSLSTNSVATVRLYRILFRQLQVLPAAPFLLQPYLNPRDYGRAKLMSSLMVTESSDSTDLFKLFARWYEEEHDDDDIDDWYQDLVGRELANEEYQVSSDDIDASLWTSRDKVRSAIQTAFRATSTTAATTQQRFAILAIHWLQDVEQMVQRSSVSMENGLRVVATSSCIGIASSGSALIHETKHRFAYRIRVENLADSDKTVQIVGRTWMIQEDSDPNSGYTPDPVIVSAPTTGAVGHLPVLQPGNVFEYMSGCELATMTGTMGGLLHMAVVDQKTPSAMVGDPIGAFQSSEKFELAVQPFPLIADTDTDT